MCLWQGILLCACTIDKKKSNHVWTLCLIQDIRRALPIAVTPDRTPADREHIETSTIRDYPASFVHSAQIEPHQRAPQAPRTMTRLRQSRRHMITSRLSDIRSPGHRRRIPPQLKPQQDQDHYQVPAKSLPVTTLTVTTENSPVSTRTVPDPDQRLGTV